MKNLLKRILCVVVFFIGVFTGNVTVLADSRYKKGDVNGDQSIDVSDAIEILRYYASKASGSKELVLNEYLYDFNSDGIIDVTDAVGVLTLYAQEAAGQIKNDQYYSFGDLLTYESTETMHKLTSEGKIVYIKVGDAITILKNHGNKEYLVGYKGSVYNLYMEKQELFTYRINKGMEEYENFKTNANVTDFCLWHGDSDIVIVDEENQFIANITYGDEFAILESLGYGQYKIVTDDGLIGIVTISLFDFCDLVYNITPVY